MAESPLEAAARASYEATRFRGSGGWHEVTGYTRELHRHQARAAIAAYEAEQPAPDLDELRVVFREAFVAKNTELRNRLPQPNAPLDAALTAVLSHLKGETR